MIVTVVMFYVLSTFHIYQNQEVSTILCTLLKRAEVVPITELFISSIPRRGMTRIPTTSPLPSFPSVVIMIGLGSILSLLRSTSYVMQTR